MTSPAGIELVRTIQMRAAFIDAQTQSGVVDATGVRQAQTDALLVTISTTSNLDIADAAPITNVISAGPWQPLQRLALINGLGDAISRISSDKGGARKTQTCLYLENYPTEADYAFFGNDDVTIAPKIQRMGEVMHAMGITCARENLLKQGAAILVCSAFKDTPLDPVSKRNIAVKLKDTIKALETANPFPFAHILNYPPTPQQLPRAIFDFAYGGDAVFNTPEMPRLSAIVASMCYRNTHKDLRPPTASTLAVPGVGGGDTMSELRALLQPLVGVVQGMLAGGRGGGSPDADSARSPDEPLLNFKPRQPGRFASPPPGSSTSGSHRGGMSFRGGPPMLDDGSSAGDTQGDGDGSAPGGGAPGVALGSGASPAADPIHALEERMRAATDAAAGRAKLEKLAKAAVAKATAKAKGKATAKGAASPKAKAKGKASPKAKAMKTVKAAKPTPVGADKAAAISELVDMIPRLTRFGDGDKKKTRGAFTSRAYDSIVRRGERLGLPAAIYTEYAKKAYSKAATVYDRMR